jgi:nanoRNase/pAp phosphatase (c-di-AMP/oligoRNAs hydrolase)
VDAASAGNLLARVRGRRVLWLLHVNADPDCVGSAFALREAFGGVVGAPEGVSRDGRALAERLGLAIDPWPHPEQFEAVVAVDTSSRSQLGRLGAQVASPLLVDHHRYGDLQEGAPALAWDPTRTSCCEVVLDLLDLAGVAPSKDAAFALLVGLAADSARFRHATPLTLRTAARLVEASGATVESAYALLDRDAEEEADDLSARKATLVAASRAQVDQWGGWLVATSEVGAYDAAAAGVLVRAGADLAVVGMERPANARMSLRASVRAREAGLHLGEVANAAAREVGWSGGGHEAAAGLQGKPPLAAAREAVLRRARAALGGS